MASVLAGIGIAVMVLMGAILIIVFCGGAGMASRMEELHDARKARGDFFAEQVEKVVCWKEGEG